MKNLIILLSLICLTSYSAIQAKKNVYQGDLLSYKKLAQAFVSSVSETKTDKKEIIKQSKDMIDLAKVTLGKITASVPYCGPILTEVITKAESMQDLSHSEIEAQFHKGSALPEMKDETKKQQCYQYKELVVHPATVIVLAKANKLNKETREQMTAEIDEVLSHIDDIKIIEESL